MLSNNGMWSRNLYEKRAQKIRTHTLKLMACMCELAIWKVYKRFIWSTNYGVHTCVYVYCTFGWNHWLIFSARWSFAFAQFMRSSRRMHANDSQVNTHHVNHPNQSHSPGATGAVGIALLARWFALLTIAFCWAHILYIMSYVDRLLLSGTLHCCKMFAFRYAHAYLLVALQTYAIVIVVIVVVAQAVHFVYSAFFEWCANAVLYTAKAPPTTTAVAAATKAQSYVRDYNDNSVYWYLLKAVIGLLLRLFCHFLIFYYIIHNVVDCVDFRTASHNFATYAKSN